MFNRTNVMLDIINKQAVSIDKLTSENERLREWYNASQNTIEALIKQLDSYNIMENNQNIKDITINKCPDCGSELEWTVVCTNCEYESHD